MCRELCIFYFHSLPLLVVVCQGWCIATEILGTARHGGAGIIKAVEVREVLRHEGSCMWPGTGPQEVRAIGRYLDRGWSPSRRRFVDGIVAMLPACSSRGTVLALVAVLQAASTHRSTFAALDFGHETAIAGLTKLDAASRGFFLGHVAGEGPWESGIIHGMCE